MIEALPVHHFQGESCLEYGAGTGLLTKFLVKNFSSITASDLSAEMLRVGKEQVPEARWELRDAWQDRDPAQHDVVASASLLQWAPDPVEVLKNWQKRLCVGGGLLAGFYTAGSLAELQACTSAVGINPTPFIWHPYERWLSFFGQAGFEIECSAEKKVLFHYDSAQSFFRSLHGVGAVGNSVGPTHLRQIIRYYEAHFSDGGSKGRKIPATWNFCIIAARAVQRAGSR